MKRLFLVLMLLVIAGSAFAAELKVSGDFYVRGSEYSNLDLKDDGNDSTWDRFDYDLNVNMAFVANENATVFTKLTFDKNVDAEGTVQDGSASADDAGLAVERAYLNYKFAPFLQLNTGLMAGGQWATTFGDTEINVMRVQFIGALSQDMIFIATYQKDTENGIAPDTDDNEKNDGNTYYLSSIMKFGPVSVKPLFTYITKGFNYNGELTQGIWDSTYAQAYSAAYAAALAAGQTPYAAAATAESTAEATADGTATLIDAAFKGKTYDLSVMAFTLGLDGDFGMFGFEAEGVYSKMDTDGFYDDCMALGAQGAQIVAAKSLYDGATYGAYVNLFAKLEPANIGFVYAYASADKKDGSYSWGDDFDVCYVMDDFIYNGSTNLVGFTVYKLYADAKFGKFGAGAAFAYGTNNADVDSKVTKDAAFKEIDANVSYAFDDNTKYSIGGGYAMTEDYSKKGDSEDAYRVFHKFAVKF